MVTVDRRELLKLLDHVDSLVCFCSVNMNDVGRYYDGGNALWAVVHRLAGDNEAADRLIAKIGHEGRSVSPSPHVASQT
ncbi:hypothetical protein [Methylobacterium bullatum]|nr:hypothetical protein [Methylobacterium bullatum]MBD8902815.1 hypothetical protein [Methylobacterium bullatum]